ncbi:hypothetical protein BH18ACI2_BH18ACI2_00230 [soil metagenome]
MSPDHTKRKKSLRLQGVCVLVVLFLLTITPTVLADRITGVTATTNMGSGFGTNLQNTVNCVGLSLLSLTATHAGTIPANSWVSNTGVLTGQITFNLGGLFSVDSFSFWNQNGGGPGFAGSTGIQNVQVLLSTNGIDFTPLPGGPSAFARVMCVTNLPPQIFSFTAVNATHFRFNVLSNYGDIFETGFAEVGFNGSPASAGPIPEPTTMLLLSTGLAAIAVKVRRKRQAGRQE